MNRREALSRLLAAPALAGVVGAAQTVDQPPLGLILILNEGLEDGACQIDMAGLKKAASDFLRACGCETPDNILVLYGFKARVIGPATEVERKGE
jgi:hypothetical protein